MARKRILSLSSYKFSMDLSGENKEAVDEATENYGMKYGPFINMLIKQFLRMPAKMKQAFISFCIFQCQELDKQLAVAGDFEKISLEDEKRHYLEIARIINAGIEVHYEESPTMRKIAMEDGYLIIPKDWIVVNEDAAPNCRYAGVVECRNHIKYGIPHFVFFTNAKYGKDYDTDAINEMCCKAWPRFKDVIAQQVEPIRDPEKPGEWLNAKEHLASPYIGHFGIDEADSDLRDIEDMPYGAMIVRTSTENSEDEAEY